MGTRVALYLRQSLDAEGTGLAIARQDKECRAYVARRQDWHVVEVYAENCVSASGRKRRPQFEKMLAAGRAGEFDVILALHLDRLTRSVRDYLPLLDLAEKYDVRTTTVSGELDLSTDMGQTLAGVLAVFAAGEIKRKGKRQMLANDQRAERGMPSQGGRRAFGYETDGMTIREAEAVHVRGMFTALLAGASLNGIANDLNKAGVTTAIGNTWNHTGVRHVLANARHAAILVHRGVEVGPAAWPPIIDETTYRAAAAILADPSRRINHVGGERRRLMTGIGLCGVCNDGKTTVVGGSRGVGKPLYQCGSEDHKHGQRLSEPVDEYVGAVVIERLSRPDAAELLIDRHAPDLEALTSERITLVARQDEAASAFAEGTITAAMMRTITAKLTTRIAEIDEQMSHRNRERVLGDLVRADDVAATWALMTLERKQAVLSELGTWTIGRGKAGGNPKGVRYPTPESLAVTFAPRES